jgi:hypothetical protein
MVMITSAVNATKRFLISASSFSYLSDDQVEIYIFSIKYLDQHARNISFFLQRDQINSFHDTETKKSTKCSDILLQP